MDSSLGAGHPEVKHQRSLLVRLDNLEEESIQLELQIKELEEKGKPSILEMGNKELVEFAQAYQNDIEMGDMETKKTVIRSIIDHAQYDGEFLKIIPSNNPVTGVKLASSRGWTRNIHVARAPPVAFQATPKSAVLPICRTRVRMIFKEPLIKSQNTLCRHSGASDCVKTRNSNH